MIQTSRVLMGITQFNRPQFVTATARNLVARTHSDQRAIVSDNRSHERSRISQDRQAAKPWTR